LVYVVVAVKVAIVVPAGLPGWITSAAGKVVVVDTPAHVQAAFAVPEDSSIRDSANANSANSLRHARMAFVAVVVPRSMMIFRARE